MITKPTIYTRDFVLSELESFLVLVKEENTILLWEQLTYDKPYSRQRVSEWKRKFGRDEQISDLIKSIDDIFKTRLIMNGLICKNPAMAIFVLKNHHDMTDKIVQESEITHKVLKARVEIVPSGIAIKNDESTL
jgi:hypothetical protein